MAGGGLSTEPLPFCLEGRAQGGQTAFGLATVM